MVGYACGSDLSDPQTLGEGLGQPLLFSSNAEIYITYIDRDREREREMEREKERIGRKRK